MDGGGGGGGRVEDAWTVLGLTPTTEVEVVKAAYRRALLRHHPDKAAAAGDASAACGADGTEALLRVQWAWTVLSRALGVSPSTTGEATGVTTATSRAAVPAISDDIDLEEMDGDAEGGGYTYPCRCGDVFRVGAADAATLPVGSCLVVGCDGCSLHIRVTRRSHVGMAGVGLS